MSAFEHCGSNSCSLFRRKLAHTGGVPIILTLKESVLLMQEADCVEELVRSRSNMQTVRDPTLLWSQTADLL